MQVRASLFHRYKCIDSLTVCHTQCMDSWKAFTSFGCVFCSATSSSNEVQIWVKHAMARLRHVDSAAVKHIDKEWNQIKSALTNSTEESSLASKFQRDLDISNGEVLSFLFNLTFDADRMSSTDPNVCMNCWSTVHSEENLIGPCANPGCELSACCVGCYGHNVDEICLCSFVF